jgi:hypothetical protein
MVCQAKDNGGLAIRDHLTINQSLILNATWNIATLNIATQKDSYLSPVLKAKYFPTTSFWLYKMHTTKSIIWSSIHEVKHLELLCSDPQS